MTNLKKLDLIDSSTPEQVPRARYNLSLVLGGPLYQFYLRARLAMPPLELLRRRVIFISLFCWLPLLLLSLAARDAVGGVPVPFLLDAEVQVRFLVALPLLIIAEVVVHRRIAPLVQQFIQRDIIAFEDRPRFAEIIASTKRLRNSAFIELALLAFSFASAHWIWRQHFTLTASTWYAVESAGNARLTPAGYWYQFLSLPVFRFLLFRWYFRIALWYQFLWRVRRLPLHLNLFHPDRAGGLGFLKGGVAAFVPVLVAHTTFLAGIIADRIWHAGATLLVFKMEILGCVIVLMVLVLAPLSFFVLRLDEAGRTASHEYGVLASRYVDDFHRKWVEHRKEECGQLLGTSDIQSLADLDNVYGVVSRIRILPIDKDTVVRLAVWLIIPILPLTLTMVPLSRIVDWFIKLAF